MLLDPEALIQYLHGTFGDAGEVLGSQGLTVETVFYPCGFLSAFWDIHLIHSIVLLQVLEQLHCPSPLLHGDSLLLCMVSNRPKDLGILW